MDKASNYTLYLSGLINESQYDLAEMGENMGLGLPDNKEPMSDMEDNKDVDAMHMRRLLDLIERKLKLDPSEFTELFNLLKTRKTHSGKSFLELLDELIDAVGNMNASQFGTMDKTVFPNK
jgi:hypothetical protein